MAFFMANIVTLPLAAPLLNGSVADAVQVMTDLNAIANSVNLNAVATSDLAAGTGANLIGYTSSFSGSTLTTTKAFLDRIASLANGAVSHSDGTNTITGSPRWFIGNATPSGDDSALLIGRALSGSYATGAHAFRDESTVTYTGTGLIGYASFDSIATIAGTLHYNHARSFQARLQYTGSGVNDEIVGYHCQHNHTGTGSVTNLYGVKMSDTLGTGPIALQAALWCDPLTRGTSNYCVYSQSPSVPSYHAGVWQTGSDIIGGAKGTFTGQVQGQAIDSTGTPVAYGASGGLGVYGYSTNPYARIQAYSNNVGAGKSLSINSAGGNVLIATITDDGVNTLQVNGATKTGSIGLTAAAPSAPAGQINFGATTAATVGAAGGAAALPATPAGYILINVAGSVARIPYYN